MINAGAVWCGFKRTDHSHEATAKYTTLHRPASVDGSQRMTELKLFESVLSLMNGLGSCKMWAITADQPVFCFCGVLKNSLLLSHCVMKRMHSTLLIQNVLFGNLLPFEFQSSTAVEMDCWFENLSLSLKYKKKLENMVTLCSEITGVTLNYPQHLEERVISRPGLLFLTHHLLHIGFQMLPLGWRLSLFKWSSNRRKLSFVYSNKR